MNNILELHKRYTKLQRELQTLEEQISDYFDQPLIYHDIPVVVSYWDESSNLITLYPKDGESSLWQQGKYLHMTFEDFHNNVGIIVGKEGDE